MGNKLALLFVFLIIVPISTVSIVSYGYYSRSLTDKATEYASRLSANLMDKLDSYMTDIERISVVPLYLTDMQQSLQTATGSLNDQRQIDLYIEVMNHMKEGTHSVYIFDSHGNVHYNIKSTGIRSDLRERYRTWREIATAADGRAVVLSAQEDAFDAEQPAFIFTVVRDIQNIYTSESIGLIAVDVRIAAIESAIEQLDAVTQGKTFILDDRGRVVYESGGRASGIAAPSDARRIAGSGSYRETHGGEPYIVSHKTSDASGWKVFVYVPLHLLTKDAATVRNVTVAVSLSIMAFALCLALLLSGAMTRPLKRLAVTMKKVQTGSLDVRFHSDRQDEVGLVAGQFNLMLDRIESLIRENIAISNRKKTAELEALQSQINPHFIYNTLEMIRMTAEASRNTEVSEMTYTFGRLLRYSINRGNEIVTVAREIEHLRLYVRMQNYRFPGKYNLTIRIDPELENYRMIKLLLQPIVENAIFHGLEKSKNRCEIVLHAGKQGGHALFVIRDNGVGMDEETLARVRQAVYSPLPPSGGDEERGIGLRNVHERIVLHYGEAYGLTIRSSPGEGTQVELKLPLAYDGEGEPQ